MIRTEHSDLIFEEILEFSDCTRRVPRLSAGASNEVAGRECVRVIRTEHPDTICEKPFPHRDCAHRIAPASKQDDQEAASREGIRMVRA